MTFGILGNLANKGPCDSGFHIPTRNELISFKTAMFNVSGSSTFMNDPTSYQNYLFFPPSYYLNRSSGTINSLYGPTRLWSCTMTDYQNAYAFYIDENNNIDTKQEKPANGFNIRAFKDEPEIPDSSWTTLYESGQGGIYWNQTKGLISLVSPGGCTTIQDHNVGATTVWQPGDTVDDNNAGLFYQFGNNYGFPYSGATEFYTTPQNVTGYGPDNPYLDSHFVKISSNNWFGNSNNNLWGGEESGTKILTEPKSISYKVTTGVEVWENQQLGLFSFTKDDGNTWTTIADKDLGASAVGGEGNLYQWGNDYGFPSTGTITRSTTTVNVDNYGPLNHYNSSTWTRTSGSVYSTTYSTSPYTYGKDLWGGATGTDIAKQGPCDSGRHIPSQAEMNNLLNFLNGLKGGSVYEQDVANWLFLPCAGSLGYADALPLNQGVTIRYWTSDLYNSSDRRGYFLSNGNGGSLISVSYTQSSSAFSIRPFSNTAVTPDSGWNQIGVNGNYEIWHKSTNGLLSFTMDGGTTWQTLSDKNLGATEVWNDGDTMTQANCGYYFQRGNNYGFPFDGQNITTTTNLVSVGGFGPGNYYSSSNFVTPTASPYTWMANPILNLRGGLGTTEDKRGPCPEGFHIPTQTEWNNNIPSLSSYLGFRTSGHYRYQASGAATSASGSSLAWWTCETSSTTSAYRVRYTTGSNTYSSFYYQYYIRPFKNEPVIPTVEDGWTRTYQGIATRDINQIYAQGNKVRPPSSTKIVLNANTKTLAVGEAFTLKATLQPEATHDTVTWTSSDTAIVTIAAVGFSPGTIVGVASGTATITGTTTSGATATCTVTVTA